MKGPFRLLVLYGLVTVGTSQVDVEQFVNGSRGKEVTLRCIYTGLETPGSISWKKGNGDSSVNIAIALSSSYRIYNTSDLFGRLNFTNINSQLMDGSIRIEDLRLEDKGDFTCAFATTDDPQPEATISLTVTGEAFFTPNVSLELNPSQLIDGMGLVTVATCVAQEGKPAASITWSGLNQGSSNETTKEEPDSTVTVRSRYWLEPTYESHGQTLTCRVEHPALESPVEFPTTLNIYFPPNVSLELNPSQLVEGMGLKDCVKRSITINRVCLIRSLFVIINTTHVPPFADKPSVSIASYDGDWYVDKEAASLTCEADANPNITHYLWDR
uniref:Nectin-3-like n=1 Tax=Petromyzon marinus TaxID=7757 RepID=A0AAJ7UB11_PETMA|nr:nectin-3-like [Petromyzon marinus]